MATLIGAISDLVKYKLIRAIDTGDRTLDSLITVIATILLSYCVQLLTTNLISYFVQFYYTIIDLFRGKDQNGPIPENQVSRYMMDPKGMKICLQFSDYSCLQAITRWVNTNYPNYQTLLNVKPTISECRSFNSPSHSLILDSYEYENLPAFIYNGQVGYLHSVPGKIVFRANNKIVAQKFYEAVKLHEENFHSNIKLRDPLVVYNFKEFRDSYSKEEISKISPFKTFDCIVSRKKPLIMGYVDRFMAGNLYGVSSGWIPNNLGILLHGEPGLGKTSFIKAICNYTHRDALLVDLRQIERAEPLEYIFKNYGNKNYVLVLEEIDFMAGVLTRKKDTPVEKKKNRDKTDMAMLLLNINSTTDENIKKDLMEEYRKNTQNLQKSRPIDLSLLLQLMDGMVESSDRLIIATTNCPDMIDSALLRPGRFDLVLKLEYFNKDEIIELLGKLLELSDEQKEDLEALNFAEGVWSPLEIIQLVINLNKNLKEITTTLCNNPLRH